MRRCPHEDDGEQDQPGEADVAGHRGPANHRRQGTRGAADDDVLRCPALEPDRVDQHVEADRQSQQAGRREVDRKPHHQHRGEGQGDAEAQGRAGLDAARRDWPLPGAGHQRVDVAVVPHVDGAGGPRAYGDAQNGGQCQHRVQSAWREVEPDEAGEHHQRHHPGLQQGDVVGHGGLAGVDIRGGGVRRGIQGDAVTGHVRLVQGGGAGGSN